MSDFRKIYDTIPAEFDRWRPRYCPGLFADLIGSSGLDSTKTVLEIGPGTGQATEPILRTGCSYCAIELGEHLAGFLKNRFSSYGNMQVIHADFETHDFGSRRFDLVYSAATIQWIPERIGFPKVHELLRSGGTFAMMLTQSDYRKSNEELYDRIQDIYRKHFKPKNEYSCKLNYENVVNYGFTELECRQYHGTRVMDAAEFASYIGTHCDHIEIQEPDRSKFYAGVRDAILQAGDRIVLEDAFVLYLTRKP